MTKMRDLIFSVLVAGFGIAVITNILSGLIYWYILLGIIILLYRKYSQYSPIVEATLWLYAIGYFIILINKIIFNHVNPIHLLFWEILIIAAILTSTRRSNVMVRKTLHLSRKFDTIYISILFIMIVIITMFLTTKINTMFFYVLVVVLTCLAWIIINRNVHYQNIKYILLIACTTFFICCIPSSHPIFKIILIILTIPCSVKYASKKHLEISGTVILAEIFMVITSLQQEKYLFIIMSAIWLTTLFILVFESKEKSLN